ncbi:uncharacterized protein LOC120643450 isoform X2 [Panicum virgatum]|uniref:uncharacterized protein LOC120643450 isoform X2 n=1 Tax=Panicum virgatum TaxID=38727 RepID=UPI0019D620F0|nr:uncharacterized protein LOC120643450 isoform X2 [Panicum virgatum]
MDETTSGSARSSSQSPRHGRRRRPPSSTRRRRRTTREVIFSFLFLPSFIPLSCPNIHAHCQYYFLCYLLSLCSSPSSCSEDRKPLYRTDPATSTSFNTSSSRCTVTQIKAILPIIFHRMEATCFACGQTVILYCKISGSSPNSNANKAAGSCCDAASDHTCVSARLGATRFSSSFGGQSEEESATEIERSQQHSSACE